MASMRAEVAEEDVGKLRLSSIEEGMWGLILQSHHLSQDDVDHEEFCQVARDHYQEAWLIMIHFLYLWIGKDHKGGACIKDGLRLEKSFDLVVIPIHHKGEQLWRAKFLDNTHCRTCLLNAIGEKILPNQFGCEVEI